MKRYGYHRTSTREQHLDRGIKEITAYCEQNNLELEKIFTDQQTGKNFNRPRYQVLKEDVLRAGDELIITEVDRLGRNKQETLKELQYYRDNGIRVKILELPTTLMDLSKLDNAMARMLMETINNMLIELYAAIWKNSENHQDLCLHIYGMVGINTIFQCKKNKIHQRCLSVIYKFCDSICSSEGNLKKSEYDNRLSKRL